MKKRILAFITCALMVLCMLPATAMAADTWDGSTIDTSWYNTTDTSFTISTGAQLAGLAKLVNQGATQSGDTPVDFKDKTITLGGDIDLGGHAWTPIGHYDSYKSFLGVFDGQGNTISGLAIGSFDNPDTSLFDSGLFGLVGLSSGYETISTSAIENLKLSITGIYTSYYDGPARAGGIAAISGGKITNCSVTGSITGSDDDTVGLITALSLGDITNCHASGTASGGTSSCVGGLVGSMSKGALTGCHADVTVTGGRAGGLAGQIAESSATGCYATGDVTGSSSSAGGFAASIDTNAGSISGCYATGDVKSSYSGGACVGGFVGVTRRKLDSCFATGNVTCGGDGGDIDTNRNCVGGFAGNSDAFTRQCFASGNVTGAGKSCIGGLIGWNRAPVENCYASGSVTSGSSNNSDIGGLLGKNDNGLAYAGSVYDCYARGAVSGSGSGLNRGAVIGYLASTCMCSSCYFDTKAAGTLAGIGFNPNSLDTAGLTPDKMTGTASLDNMTALDKAKWTAKANGSKWYFPQLRVFTGGSNDTVKDLSLTSVSLTPFTVAFNSNSGSAVASEYGYYSAVSKPADPSRPGFNFDGWYTELNAAYDFGTTVTADITLHANWKKENYTITYDLKDGAVATPNPAGYDVETTSFTLVNPAKTGYSFGGWTGTDLSGATMTVTIPKGSTGNRSYTATWTKADYGITYNLNGGTLTSPNPAGYSVESDTITLNNPTKAGCNFAGWTGTDLSGAVMTVTIPKGSAGNRTYTATWTPKGTYAIKASANNKKFGKITGMRTYPGGETVTLTAIPADGYRFVNWMEGTTKVSSTAVYSFTAVKARTLTANFAKIGTPTLSSVKAAGKGSIKITWKSVSGAKGYYIYRASGKSGKYSRIKTVDGALTFRDTGLKKGRTYFYKVQAYCAAGTKITKGGFSRILSAKVK